MPTLINLPRFADLPDDALVRLPQIIPHQVPVSRATWYRMLKDGRAPAPIMTLGVVAWRVGDIRAMSSKAS